MSGTWVYRDGKLVPKGEALARDYHSIKARSDLPSPGIISDNVEYRSMATGEWITGRRQHREHMRANGLVEVGNEKVGAVTKPAFNREELARDIKTAIDQVEAGYVPPEGPTGVESIIGSTDEDGNTVEMPQMESINTDAITSDGQYIRQETDAPAVSLKV